MEWWRFWMWLSKPNWIPCLHTTGFFVQRVWKRRKERAFICRCAVRNIWYTRSPSITTWQVSLSQAVLVSLHVSVCNMAKCNIVDWLSGTRRNLFLLVLHSCWLYFLAVDIWVVKLLPVVWMNLRSHVKKTTSRKPTLSSFSPDYHRDCRHWRHFQRNKFSLWLEGSAESSASARTFFTYLRISIHLLLWCQSGIWCQPDSSVVTVRLLPGLPLQFSCRWITFPIRVNGGGTGPLRHLPAERVTEMCARRFVRWDHLLTDSPSMIECFF